MCMHILTDPTPVYTPTDPLTCVHTRQAAADGSVLSIHLGAAVAGVVPAQIREKAVSASMAEEQAGG